MSFCAVLGMERAPLRRGRGSRARANPLHMRGKGGSTGERVPALARLAGAHTCARPRLWFSSWERALGCLRWVVSLGKALVPQPFSLCVPESSGPTAVSILLLLLLTAEVPAHPTPSQHPPSTPTPRQLPMEHSFPLYT